MSQEAQHFCDYLQRVVADFGDEDGTKTSKAKSTSENRLDKFHKNLGKAHSKKKSQLRF